MRIGAPCAGYGGLEMGLQAVIGGEVAWHAETDPDASKILAHHYPGVPNHGDLTTLAWAQHPVDVLCAGFPCQPVSHAGKRAGVTDERWLFDDIVAGIGRMDPRPRLLVFENVLGLLSANSGDAMARVVQGLASVGYVGRWRLVRASDAGAPHGRRRVFLVAWPAADARGERHGRRQDPRSLGPVDGEDAGRARQRERAREVAGDRSDAPAADADSLGLQSVRGVDPVGRDTDRRGGADIAWGQYEPAIRRWETVLGRVAPPPTEPGAKGQPRLSPKFVEWMQGLPAGHVTDVPISRNAQLKALGNGVVPQQAELALRWLLGGQWLPAGASDGLLPTPTTRDWKDTGDFTPHPEKTKPPHTIKALADGAA